MTVQEAIIERHSVRAYKDETIPEEVRRQLDALIDNCNREGNLHIFACYDEPEGFNSRFAHYGSFRNVRNYIVLSGRKDEEFDFRCGYYGEKVVLGAQQLGLNTCWAALTFNKKSVRALLGPDESLCMVFALGYGETPGRPHRGKRFEDVSKANDPPKWFRQGVEAALLAPTAVNQQKFRFLYHNGQASLQTRGIGPCLKTDLGIVKYHFEIASGHEVKVI